jgi:hypothetical protein
VVIELNKKAADYFKRRKIFPTQDTKLEKQDGSLTVGIKVGKYEDVKDMIKSWLPNIVILMPEELRNDVVADMKNWIAWQTSSYAESQSLPILNSGNNIPPVKKP